MPCRSRMWPLCLEVLLWELQLLLFEEARKVKDFKPISEDLLSTLERLVPIIDMIDSMHVKQGSGPCEGELTCLLKTMERAKDMVSKCSRVQWYSIRQKARYTRKIKGINQDLLRFCQLDLQLIQYKYQLHSMSSLSTKIDILSDTAKGSAELFVVPQPETVTIYWLHRPLRELKKMLLEDLVVTVVVSAPSACGKTMLVTKLCHDADVKGRSGSGKEMFFDGDKKATKPKVQIDADDYRKYKIRNAGVAVFFSVPFPRY